MRSGVLPISARSSICRTRKSATSARLITPNRQSFGLVSTRVLASCRPVGWQAGPHNGPLETRGPDNPLLYVLVVIDTLQEQGKGNRIVEKTAIPAAVTGTKTRYGD